LEINDCIATTIKKAKYLQPMAEYIIHKAKIGGSRADHFMKKTFFLKAAGQKAIKELAPRFKYLIKSHNNLGIKEEDLSKLENSENVKWTEPS
jgi:hypothetical protein